MPSESQPENSAVPGSGISSEHEAFLEGSGRRMYRGMWVLGIAGTAAFGLWHGWRSAGGFAIGAALSALNFHWLHRAVASVTELLATTPDAALDAPPKRAPGAIGSAFRIAVRYALIAATGYAIFVSSFVNLNAFFAGLFLFLGAVLIEAAYEVYCGLRGT